VPRLGTRSIVAVPIASAHGTIGLLEAFSAEPHGFNDSDVRSLKLARGINSLRHAARRRKPAGRNFAAVGGRETVETPSRRIRNQELVAPEEFFKAEETAGPESAPEIFRSTGRNRISAASLQ